MIQYPSKFKLNQIARFDVISLTSMILLAGLAIFGVVGDIRQEYLLSASDIINEDGFAYTATVPKSALWLFETRSDSMRNPHKAKTQIFEDDQPLGPAHSQHEFIRNQGQGHYSHWESIIYFSTSDNSDPRTNGRQYRAVVTATVPSWLVGVLTVGLVTSLYLNRQLFLPLHPLLITAGILLLRTAERIALSIGLLLFFVNIAGLIIPLRNPAIYTQTTGFKDDITLTEEQLYEKIRATSSDRREYVTTLTEAVNKGIANYWDDAGITKYNLRVPFYENYLLFAASFINPDAYLKYEFMNYRRAIERGIGLCSQQAIIVTEVLKEKGISSQIVGLNGHTVATAQVDADKNEWWILDPDYGVVMPYSLNDIEKNPAMIIPYYSARDYTEENIALLVEIYGKEGNVIVEGDGAINYMTPMYQTETIHYILKWAIPILLILPIALRICFRISFKFFNSILASLVK